VIDGSDANKRNILSVQLFAEKLHLPHKWKGLGLGSRYSDSLRAGRSGDWILVRARFTAPAQTGPGAHPASFSMCTGSFPGVKRPGRGFNYPPPPCAEVRERVELYLYSPSGLLQGEIYSLHKLKMHSQFNLCLGWDGLFTYNRRAQIFQKSTSILNILGVRRFTWSKLHTEDPQILSATVHNLLAMATCRPGFVRPWLTIWFTLECWWLNMFKIIYSSLYLAIWRPPTVHKTRNQFAVLS
jgi:hypothetical protein